MSSFQLHRDINLRFSDENFVYIPCFLVSDPKRITLNFNFVKNPEHLEQIYKCEPENSMLKLCYRGNVTLYDYKACTD